MIEREKGKSAFRRGAEGFVLSWEGNRAERRVCVQEKEEAIRREIHDLIAQRRGREALQALALWLQKRLLGGAVRIGLWDAAEHRFWAAAWVEETGRPSEQTFWRLDEAPVSALRRGEAVQRLQGQEGFPFQNKAVSWVAWPLQLQDEKAWGVVEMFFPRALTDEQSGQVLACLRWLQSYLLPDLRLCVQQRRMEQVQAALDILRHDANDWLFWLRPDGRYRLLTPAISRYTGQAVRYFLQDPMRLLQYIHPEDREKMTRHWDEDLPLEREAAFEFRVQHPNGRLFWLRHVCQPVYDSNGRYQGRLGSNQDITPLKQHEADLVNRMRNLEVLHEIMQKFIPGMGAADYAAVVLEVLAQTLHWRYAVVRRYDAEADRFQVLAAMYNGKLAGEADLRRLNRLVRTADDGITGWAVRNRKAMRVSDLRRTSRNVEVWPEMRSGLYVPLMYYGQPLGALTVESPLRAAFSPGALQLLQAIAAQVAGTLENIRLMNEVQQRMNDLAALYEATRQLATSRLDADQVYRTLHEAVARLMPFDALTIVVYDAEHQRARAVYLYEDGQHFPAREIPWGAGLSGRVWRARRPLLFRDYSRSRQIREQRYTFGKDERVVRSVLAVPLQLGTRLIGMISVQSYQRGLYGSHEKSLLQNLSAQASVALENLRLFAEREQHVRELEAVLSVMRLLTVSQEEPQEVVASILREALRVIPSAEKGALFLRSRSGRLHVRAAVGYQDERLFALDFSDVDGFLGLAVRERRPVLASHVAEKYPLPFAGALPEVNEVQSGIAVPLINDGEIIGAISLDSISDPQAFTEHDLSLLEAFAQTAALVLERVRTLTALQERLRQLEILAQIAADIRENITQDEILRLALRRLVEMFSLRVALVFYPAPDGKTLQARHGSGPDWDEDEAIVLPVENSLGGRVLRSGQAEFVEDIQPDDTRLHVRSATIRDGDTLAVLPLLDGRRVVGVFSLLRDRHFSQQERAMLQMTAEMLGNALARSRLLAETRDYARKLASINELGRLLAEAEDLTGLYRQLMETVHTILPQNRLSLLWRWNADLEEVRLAAASRQPGRVQLEGEERTCPLADLCDGCQRWEETIVIPSVTASHCDASWLHKLLPQEDLQPICLLFGQKERSFGRGILQFWLPPGVQLSARDREVLHTVSGVVAAEIANSEYLAQSRRQAEHWTQLVTMAHALAASSTPEQIYRVIYDTFRQVFGCENLMYSELDERRQMFRPVFSVREARQEDVALLEALPYTPYRETVSRCRAASLRSVLWRVEDTNGDRRTVLFAPVMYASQVRGVLTLSWRGARFFAEDERQMIESIASQMAVTLRNHDLMKAQTYRMEQLQTLHAVDLAITTSVDPDVALDVILKEAQRMLKVEIVALLAYDQALHQFLFRAGKGYHQRQFADLTTLGPDALPFKTLTTLQPIFLPRLESNYLDEGMRKRLAAENIQAAAWLPLVSKGTFHGVLELCTRQPLEMPAEWREFALAMAGQTAIALDNFRLFEQLQESNRELRSAYDATIEGWALALEMRDRETEGHTRRVTELTVQLARRLGVSDEELVHIRRGALLHDIGKMGVPDAILHKPDSLTPEEWAIMRKHPEFAYRFLSRIAYLRPALDIPYSHHEKWDGSGYPLGLQGEEIPLAARIFAVADVYDALATDRPYRKAWPRAKVLRYIAEQAGRHFDPHIVAVFLEMMREQQDTPLP